MIMEGMWQAGVLHNELSLYGNKKLPRIKEWWSIAADFLLV